MDLRTTGRIVAAVLFVVVAGIVGFAVWNHQSVPPAGGGAAGDPEARTPPPINLIVASPEATTIEDVVVQTDKAMWTRFNPDTGDLEYKLTWEQLEPEARGVFLLTQPDVSIYRDDRLVRVSSQHARIVWPDRTREPESGLLEGDVVIQAFEWDTGRGPDGSSPEDSGVLPDQPALGTLRANSLSFQSTLMELSTGDDVVIEAPGFFVEGRGLTVRINEVRQRLKFLRLEERHTVRYSPAEARHAAEARQSIRDKRPGRTRQASDRASAGPERTPEIDLYAATLSGGVQITQTGRSLDAEQIELFARLLDGALSDEAIAPIEFSSSEEPSDRAGARSAFERSRAAGGSVDDTVQLGGTGPLEIRPLREVPTELNRDDVFVRILSPKSNIVTITDSESGATFRCVSLTYGATSRIATAYGLAGMGVTAIAPGVAEIIIGRCDQNLTTGEGAFPGPGMIRLLNDRLSRGAAGSRAGDTAEIRWTDACEFVLDTSLGPVGTDGIILPTEVRFRGRVEARADGRVIRGDSIHAWFETIEDPLVGGAKLGLRRLLVEGNAEADAADGGVLTADVIDVTFTTPYGETNPVPVHISARGNVRTADRRGELHAELLDADLTRDEERRLIASHVEARIGVFARSRDQIELTASNLVTDHASGAIEVRGEPAVISQVQEGKGQTLSGGQISIDTVANQISVAGPGNASYSARREDAPGYDRVQVEWSQRMVYNDLTGGADVEGDSVITAERRVGPGLYERHVGRGERLTVNRAPYTGQETSKAQRPLLEAVIYGGRYADKADAPAELDLRRYAETGGPGEPQRLEGLMNLRGPRIVLDGQTQRLIVPDAGMLVIEDRRTPSDSPGRARSADDHFPDIAGTTGFWWDGSLTLDRTHGLGRMSRRVRMVHVQAETGLRTEMESEELVARIGDPSSAGAATPAAPSSPPAWERPSQPDTLQAVEALGAVYVQHGRLKLIGDKMHYDDRLGLIRMSAMPGNRMTVLDGAKGSHLVAESVTIDVRTGEWRITRGVGVGAPN